MKLMKHIMIALVLCAIPAVAFGQVDADTECPDPCYVAPYFSGSGGFVGKQAMADNAATMDKDEGAVTFAVTCDNVITTGSADVDDMGIARQVFNMDNGLACGAADGKIEISNLDPGGWYWIHDDPNSAVSSLVNVNVLGNANMVKPTDPGGVTMTAMEGGAATFVKHEASGRVGILGHVMATPDPMLCGGATNVANNCMLKATYGIGLMVGTKDIGGTVTRGGTDGMTQVDVMASVTGSGYILIDATMPVGAEFGIAGAGSTTTNMVTHPGVSISGSTIEVAAEHNGRCAATNPDRSTPVGVVVTATPSKTPNALPALGAAGVKRTFNVVCPSLASSSGVAGQELVPENPFPVE